MEDVRPETAAPRPPDFRALFEAAPGLHLVLAPNFLIVAVSNAYLRATMTAREHVVGRGLFDVFPDNPHDPHATGARNLRASLERVLRYRAADIMPVQQYDIRRPSDAGGGFEERHWCPVNTPVLGPDGAVSYIIHQVEDVTELVRLRRQRSELEVRADQTAAEKFRHAQQLHEANRQLREANDELTQLRADLERRVAERTAQLAAANDALRAEIEGHERTERELARQRGKLRVTLESIGDAVVATDADGRVTVLNRVAEALTGWAAADAVGRPLDEVVRVANRHTRAAVEAPVRRVLATGESVWRTNHTVLVARDGTERPIDDAAAPIRDETGAPLGVVLTFRDVTERRRLEEQLREAQKLEAVGRLAGGVAHDFNNLLTVINGYADVLLAAAPADDPRREALAAVRDAGRRAAGLTGQLLAFGRRAIVEPRVLDLNAVIDGLVGLLHRAVGAGVVLVTAPAPGLHRVRADPTQVEQILVNLAVNARDAMPTGGRLTIGTQNVYLSDGDANAYSDLPPGPYVRLTVSDTGVGMTDDVKARAFEPFFTTKEQGKGTGLGLATVYGAVKTHGGHVAVSSEPNAGSTFTVLLPATLDAVAPRSGEIRIGPRGSETILIAEDDDTVRKLTCLALESQGYAVLDGGYGRGALCAADGHRGPIHLLVTDVVMPELGGRELADALRARRPGVKVLYVSGYTDDAVVRHGIVTATDAFLQKPFSPPALARKVREVLDGA